MTSRRDEVQAHVYVLGRLSSALVHGEPDARETPLRRTTLGSFGGLMIGALLVAGFLVWGLLFPGATTAAPASGTLVVDGTTDTRYIYADGELRPVLNWASALLLLGGQPKVSTMSDKSLAVFPHGQPLGILGAPDALPSAATASRSNWLVCAPSAPGGSGASHPIVTLAIGGPPAARPVPGGGAVVVQTTNGTRYLLWDSQRLRIDAPWILEALGLGRAPVTVVNPAWLNALPAGPDLQRLAVPGLGRPGPSLGQRATRVGQVLVVHNVGSPDEFYLAETGSLSPISSTQAAVELADPASAAAYGSASVAPVQVSAAAIAAAPVSRRPLADGAGAPATPPAASSPGAGEAPCVDYSGPAAAPRARLVFAVPPAGQPPAVGMLGVTASPAVAGQIAVAPGSGAFVRPQSAPSADGEAFFLVTDLGIKYPIPSVSAARALGYQPAKAVALPAALLGLLPTGPSLDLPALGG
jgi:type VII secretion protein EccB